MNKNIITLSVVSVFLLLAISFSAAVSSDITTTFKKRESPLFFIRTKRAIKTKIGTLMENIKAQFIGERVFFLPFQFLRDEDDISIRVRLAQKRTIDSSAWNCEGCTCVWWTCYTFCGQKETCYTWKAC